jgi:hypothetical protein
MPLSYSTLTPTRIYDYAAVLLEFHLQWQDQGPKCSVKVLLQVLFYVAGHLCSVVDRLNSIPRKVFNYQTPLEVFTSYMMTTGRIES